MLSHLIKNALVVRKRILTSCINHHSVKALSTKSALKENVAQGENKFITGSTYHGFVCTDVQHVSEFNLTAIMFQHEKTKTEYLHLQRDDPNNVFSINFRTTPFNSTGLPHILEHIVLCGSKKYPVRDPFFKMLNRSMATFMNAMTGADYTMYPFSSQNEVDYRNLQKIYLDAVFEPNLNHMDFLQEGWRLEYSDLNNKGSNLKFKGVVFNEMKGAFSENSAIFGQKFLNTILPSHTYGYVSGGDPLQIPNLTVKDLREFHGRYYHPSNSKLFSYGNFPVEKNLEICDQLYLNRFDCIDSSHSIVPSQPRWDSPLKMNVECRYDKMGAPLNVQNQIAVGYLMCDITNIYETFVLQVLSQLLVTGPNSAFYKSLVEPNISGGFNSTTGYDPSMKDTMFAVGLQDLEVDKFEKVEEIIQDTINKTIVEGFDKNHLESVIHGIELGIKHQTTKFGLTSLFNLVPLWNHGGSVMEALQVEKFLSTLKEKLKNPKYLTERLEHYFVSNNHKLTLTMTPDEAYESKLAKEEERLLSSKINSLNDKDKADIYDNGLKLATSQKSQENIDVLPCLALKDIAKEMVKVPLKLTKMNEIPTQICKANTNNVTYFRAVLDMTDLTDEMKFLIPLFNDVVIAMDTKKRGYREFDQLVNLKTGGLSFSTHIVDQVNNPGKYEQGVLISSHCLDHNLEEMMSIWREIFDKPLFKDTNRFKMLYDQYVSNLTCNIASNGHVYAMQGASSLVSKEGILKENIMGLKHVNFIKSLKNISSDGVMRRVAEIAAKMLNGNRMRMAINLSKDRDEKFLSAFEGFSKSIPFTSEGMLGVELSQNENVSKITNCMHYVNNFSVNYCAKAIKTVPFVHKDFAKLRVLAKFLSSKYLHPVVREQNGAYGGGAMVNDDGVFMFFSYRDPNCRVTLDVFDNVADWFKNNHKKILNEQSLFEAKLGILQKIDAPIAECNKGMYEFLSGMSDDILQKHRNDVLNTTVEELVYACDMYLTKIQSGKCVVGPGETSGKNLTKGWENWSIVNFDK